MRFPTLALCLLMLSSAWAAAPEGGVPVIYKKDVVLHTVYAWERWGNFINAAPGDGKEIPYDAAKLKARVYAFPSGQIRVIEFDRGVRTHDHVNMTDTVLYTWTGRRVLFANGDAAIAGPGDASFHPKGVFHHGEALEGGYGIEFAMEVDHTWPDPQPVWGPRESRPTEPAAVWLDHGKVLEAYGASAASAPADAAHFEARVFDFPPYYTARELHIPRGVSLPIQSAKDRLMLLLAGHATVALDGRSWPVGPEDAVRAPAGRRMTMEATDDCKIIETDVPPVRP